MDHVIQYGPYSPQDMDRVSQWLLAENIQFEILRNDQEAKEALMNDGQNIINLADLRTGIYLAQIFYLNLIKPSIKQKELFEEKFGLKAESFKAQNELPAEQGENQLANDSLKHQHKKRMWAITLAALLIIQIVIALYFIIIKES